MAVYLFLVLAFGGWYRALYRLDHAAFGDIPAGAGQWTFVYFSLVTMTSFAPDPLTPGSGAAQFLVAAQVVVGLVWTVLVFAVAVAALAPEFERLARDQSGAKPVEEEIRALLAEIRRDSAQRDAKVDDALARLTRHEEARPRGSFWSRLLGR